MTARSQVRGVVAGTETLKSAEDMRKHHTGKPGVKATSRLWMILGDLDPSLLPGRRGCFVNNKSVNSTWHMLLYQKIAIGILPIMLFTKAHCYLAERHNCLPL